MKMVSLSGFSSVLQGTPKLITWNQTSRQISIHHRLLVYNLSVCCLKKKKVGGGCYLESLRMFWALWLNSAFLLTFCVYIFCHKGLVFPSELLSGRSVEVPPPDKSREARAALHEQHVSCMRTWNSSMDFWRLAMYTRGISGHTQGLAPPAC